MTITATQIKITNFSGLIKFFFLVGSIRKQLSKADGLLFVKLKGFKTITGWKNLESMHNFRNNGAHLNAMKNIKYIGKAKSVTWQSEIEPNWDEATIKLKQVTFNQRN